jgi:hypothetical protein
MDFANNIFTWVNFELLCDIEVLCGLAILLPLLEKVNNLMKSSQAQDVFVVDYVLAI